jgi:serine/threonine protein kinase/Tfp pilus assembly protein PilF
MTQERFARLERLFEQASALDPDARARFLAAECGDDPDLRREVEALLAANAETDRGFAQMIGRAVRDALESGIDIAGRRIGPYRIVRTIGQGGMGAVYLAERADEQYRGHVAIKLGNTLFATPAAIERLRGERQILANLDHPNIARLLDGGTTDEGMPYLIMEYIEGLPIDVYCDSQRLGVRERLGIFCTVCAAVQYAHEHLVVHRDIKPSNILVTSDGWAKLLDFGIAKLLDEGDRAARAQQHTVAEQRMLSPEFASPEHILGRPITTASDIYSLGVLLYKLLAGRLPYGFVGGSLLELAEIVTTATPALPSAAALRAEDGGPQPAVVAHARRTTPERLARALRGDLDNIVMMALRKEPERRYRSASQFADDIRRHLAGLPVAARRDTWTYRSGKFVKRHPFGIATGVAASLFVVGYAATLVVQNERIRAEQARAEAAAEFLVGLFGLFDPRQAQGRQPTVADVLKKGEERLETDLRDQPELRATLLDALGRVYYSHGDYEEARVLLERALESRRAANDTSDLAFAQTLSALAVTYFDLEEVDRAERLQQEALGLVSAATGEASLATAKNMTQLGRVLADKGQLDDAEHALRQAIAIFEERGERGETLSVAQNFLASVLLYKGELAEAQALYTQMLARDAGTLGENHPLVLKNRAGLAVVLEQRGDFARARCEYVAALAGMRRVLGEDHPDVGGAVNGLARVLFQLGDLAGAEEQLRVALEIDRARSGSGHWTVAYDEAKLASVLHARGNLADAEALYRSAIAGYGDNPGRLTNIGVAQQGLGDVLIELGRYDEAEAMLDAALASFAAAPSPPASWFTVAETRASQGRLALARGRYDEARVLLEDALAEIAMHRDRTDLRVRRVLKALAETHERAGHPELAEPYRRRLTESEAALAQLASADCGASLR